MRRLLLAAAVASGAAFATPAAADPRCLIVTADQSTVGVCAEYVCVDICAPEVHVDPQCDIRTNPPSILVEAICFSVDAMHVVVP